MKQQIERIAWREMVWNRPFSLQDVYAALLHLASLTPRGAVVFEIRGGNGKIRYFLGADSLYIHRVENVFQTQGQVQFADLPPEARQGTYAARQLKISHPVLSLNTDTTQAAIRAALAAMAGCKSSMVVQVVFGRSFSPSSVPAELPDPEAGWVNILRGCVPKASAETRRSVRAKAEEYSFQAVIRLGTSDPQPQLLNGLLSAFKTLESAGVKIRGETESPEKITNAHVPWSFPLRLSVKELASFLLLPAGEEELPGVAGVNPRTILLPNWYKTPTAASQTRTFGVSLDTPPKKLSISPNDSLLHTVICGPTGGGKSTVILNIILSDIKSNKSVLIIDPKQTLAQDVMSRVPENRLEDVVIIDPTSPSPCGINPLNLNSYSDPSLIADAVLAVFQQLWSDSWGVRIQDCLTAALMTLAEIDGATLLWILPLLTDDGIRRKIVSQIKNRVGLMPFWNEYEALSPAMRQTWIAPIANKLRVFTMRAGLRSVLGQARPKFNLTELFTKRKIVLVSLNKGSIGAGAAKMLGSIIVGLTWTLALSRAKLPPERRHPVEIYIDETQDYLRLGNDINDALAQARGLGVGFTLAHQFRDQLPPEIRAGVDANTLNKIVFGLNSKDAKDYAAMASGLTPEDFMALPRYHIYTQFQVSGKSTGWVSGRTLPPPPALRDPAEVYAQSMSVYGTPAEEVEDEYLKIFGNGSTLGDNSSDAPIGRRKR